jgi:hypothetical protein
MSCGYNMGTDISPMDLPLPRLSRHVRPPTPEGYSFCSQEYLIIRSQKGEEKRREEKRREDKRREEKVGEQENISPVLKVPRQCPLVLLVEVIYTKRITFI